LADLIWLYLTRAANPMSGSHEDQGLPELLTSCSAVAWTVAVTAEEKIEVFLLSRELGLAPQLGIAKSLNFGMLPRDRPPADHLLCYRPLQAALLWKVNRVVVG
jgi:hypothetical protein